MASAKGKQVAARQPQEVATTELDQDLLNDAGSGFEEANKDAFAIPFLRILQDLSPQVKSKMAGYIKGAEPGMVFNTVSQELYEGDVTFIPCHYSQRFIEWKPRKKGEDGGGGFVAAYDQVEGAKKMAQTTKDGGKNILPNGNELSDTREHYGLVVRPDGTAEGCLISMASSALKVSRRWMSQMRSATIEVNGRLVQPPMFAWSYKLGREEEANDQGQWYQWTVSGRERVTNKDLYNQAKAFGTAMRAGSGKIDYEHARTESRGGRDRPADLDNEIDA